MKFNAQTTASLRYGARDFSRFLRIFSILVSDNANAFGRWSSRHCTNFEEHQPYFDCARTWKRTFFFLRANWYAKKLLLLPLGFAKKSTFSAIRDGLAIFSSLKCSWEHHVKYWGSCPCHSQWRCSQHAKLPAEIATTCKEDVGTRVWARSQHTSATSCARLCAHSRPQLRSRVFVLHDLTFWRKTSLSIMRSGSRTHFAKVCRNKCLTKLGSSLHFSVWYLILMKASVRGPSLCFLGPYSMATSNTRLPPSKRMAKTLNSRQEQYFFFRMQKKNFFFECQLYRNALHFIHQYVFCALCRRGVHQENKRIRTCFIIWLVETIATICTSELIFIPEYQVFAQILMIFNVTFVVVLVFKVFIKLRKDQRFFETNRANASDFGTGYGFLSFSTTCFVYSLHLFSTWLGNNCDPTYRPRLELHVLQYGVNRYRRVAYKILTFESEVPSIAKW